MCLHDSRLLQGGSVEICGSHPLLATAAHALRQPPTEQKNFQEEPAAESAEREPPCAAAGTEVIASAPEAAPVIEASPSPGKLCAGEERRERRHRRAQPHAGRHSRHVRGSAPEMGVEEPGHTFSRAYTEPAPQQDMSDESDGGECAPFSAKASGALDASVAPPEVLVANEVLRLRLAKSQHDQHLSVLSQAEQRVKGLSTFELLRLRRHLERSSVAVGQPVALQEALARLLGGLCLVSGVGVSPGSLASVLRTATDLLQDSGSFVAGLCNAPPLSCKDAACLAPYLVSTTGYQETDEPEVDRCFEILREWLLAYYFVSIAAGDARRIGEELARAWEACLAQRMRGARPPHGKGAGGPAVRLRGSGGARRERWRPSSPHSTCRRAQDQTGHSIHSLSALGEDDSMKSSRVCLLPQVPTPSSCRSACRSGGRSSSQPVAAGVARTHSDGVLARMPPLVCGADLKANQWCPSPPASRHFLPSVRGKFDEEAGGGHGRGKTLLETLHRQRNAAPRGLEGTAK